MKNKIKYYKDLIYMFFSQLIYNDYYTKEVYAYMKCFKVGINQAVEDIEKIHSEWR